MHLCVSKIKVYVNSINIQSAELVLVHPPLFWEGFPRDVGTLLQGLASIQPEEH
jgi:hypothetical protein